VTIDGRSVEGIPEQELRRMVAWVPQEPPLFPNATIADNIAYGLEGASLEMIQARDR